MLSFRYFLPLFFFVVFFDIFFRIFSFIFYFSVTYATFPHVQNSYVFLLCSSMLIRNPVNSYGFWWLNIFHQPQEMQIVAGQEPTSNALNSVLAVSGFSTKFDDLLSCGLRVAVEILHHLQRSKTILIHRCFDYHAQSNRNTYGFLT